MIAYINLFIITSKIWIVLTRDISIKYKANYKAKIIKWENLMEVRQDKLIKTLTKRSHSITALKLKFAARYYLMQNSRIVMPAAAVRYCWLVDCGFHAWNLNASDINAFRDYIACSPHFLPNLNSLNTKFIHVKTFIQKYKLNYIVSLKVVLDLLSRNARNFDFDK